MLLYSKCFFYVVVHVAYRSFPSHQEKWPSWRFAGRFTFRNKRKLMSVVSGRRKPSSDAFVLWDQVCRQDFWEERFESWCFSNAALTTKCNKL